MNNPSKETSVQAFPPRQAKQWRCRIILLLVVGFLALEDAAPSHAQEPQAGTTHLPAEVDSAALAHASWAYRLDRRILLEVHDADNYVFQELMHGIHRSAIPIFWSTIPATWGGALLAGDGFGAAYRLTLSQLAADRVTILLKRIFGRHRPFVVLPGVDTRSGGLTRERVLLEENYRYSFPSGHATTSFAIATSLSLSFPEWYVVAPALTWASAMAVSRMWLGVHYPSDVVAGAVVGAGVAAGVYLLRSVITPSFLKNSEQKPTTLLRVRIPL